MDYLTMYKYYRRILCFSTGTWLCYHNRAIWTGARVAQSTVKQHQFNKSYKIELVDSVIHYCATVMPKIISPNPYISGIFNKKMEHIGAIMVVKYNWTVESGQGRSTGQQANLLIVYVLILWCWWASSWQP